MNKKYHFDRGPKHAVCLAHVDVTILSASENYPFFDFVATLHPDTNQVKHWKSQKNEHEVHKISAARHQEIYL